MVLDISVMRISTWETGDYRSQQITLSRCRWRIRRIFVLLENVQNLAKYLNFFFTYTGLWPKIYFKRVFKSILKSCWPPSYAVSLKWEEYIKWFKEKFTRVWKSHKSLKPYCCHWKDTYTLPTLDFWYTHGIKQTSEKVTTHEIFRVPKLCNIIFQLRHKLEADRYFDCMFKQVLVRIKYWLVKYWW